VTSNSAFSRIKRLVTYVFGMIADNSGLGPRRKK